MKRLPKGVYTPEFRAEAVNLVTNEGLSIQQAAQRLSIPKSSLSHWVQVAKTGDLSKVGQQQPLRSEADLELAKLRKELAETRMERDFLKKCAAYFVKESR